MNLLTYVLNYLYALWVNPVYYAGEVLYEFVLRLCYAREWFPGSAFTFGESKAAARCGQSAACAIRTQGPWVVTARTGDMLPVVTEHRRVTLP